MHPQSQTLFPYTLSWYIIFLTFPVAEYSSLLKDKLNQIYSILILTTQSYLVPLLQMIGLFLILKSSYIILSVPAEKYHLDHSSSLFWQSSTNIVGDLNAKSNDVQVSLAETMSVFPYYYWWCSLVATCVDRFPVNLSKLHSPALDIWQHLNKTLKLFVNLCCSLLSRSWRIFSKQQRDTDKYSGVI